MQPRTAPYSRTTVSYGETIKHQQRTTSCDSELAEFTLKHQSWQTWCPNVPELPPGSAADSWPARPAPKVPAIAGATLVPAVPSHGILQTPKYEPGSVRVAPGLVINERLFVEELVIPDSTVATTEWRLDLLETRLNFLSGSELWGTLRHPDPLPVSRLPWKSGWPCYVSLCN